jgi:5-methylthioribose kinase
MLELTADNTAAYLRQQGWIGPGAVQVTELGWGVSNAVLRVQTPEQTFVLKQSRPQLRTRDAWFSDLDRVYRELEVIQVLEPVLPPGVVPRVLFSDRDNYVFAMSHAPESSRVWKEMLLAGEVDVSRGVLAGRILGRIHQATASRPDLIEAFRDHTVFVQLRVDPFYRRLQERRPEVASAIALLVEQSLTVKEALCHGDFSPKNLLAHENGFTLVDYETACFGDPTFDLGFFLSHLVLKGIHRHDQRQQFWDLTEAFWDGYAQAVSWRPVTELQPRAIGHFAACALARIDGTSPVDYLPQEPKRDAVRRLARRLWHEAPTTWRDALRLIDEEVRHAAP